MTGEIFALLSAGLYGIAGVAITKGHATARGDNGVFLSVLFTAFLTLVVWACFAEPVRPELYSRDGLKGVVLFVLSGVFATALGRNLMYRSTELLGAVNASLLRRLIPVLSVPSAMLILGEAPDVWVLLGGALILFGVFFYLNPGFQGMQSMAGTGLMFGVGSATCYALAYSQRRLGLEFCPDPVLGTFIGAVAGAAWIFFLGWHAGKLDRLLRDIGAWHWAAAFALSLGQLLQFFALQAASVPRVAAIGSLDVLFSALLAGWVLRSEQVRLGRFLIAAITAMIGTVVIFR